MYIELQSGECVFSLLSIVNIFKPTAALFQIRLHPYQDAQHIGKSQKNKILKPLHLAYASVKLKLYTDAGKSVRAALTCDLRMAN